MYGEGWYYVLLAWIARPGRVPVWNVLRSGGTYSGLRGKKPRSTGRCRQTHRETSPLSCRERRNITGLKKWLLLFCNWKCISKKIVCGGKKKEEEELYVSNPVSWPLVPTEELRLMMRRSTSFLSKTREAGPSSDIALPPKWHIWINIQYSPQ